MAFYIRGTGNISPQHTAGQGHFPEGPLLDHTGTRLACAEPDYATLIDVKLIRRMSRIIRMGVAAAMECLKEAGIEQPGAIVTGTAYGCLEDTGQFITKMVANKEELLTPTAFIQSTHNTIGAQIGLMLRCNQYNNAFVHRGFSFESALLDAMMLLNEKEAAHVLVGAVDEITAISHTILTRMGLYRRRESSSLGLIDKPAKGTMAGEGAAFFLLSADPSEKDIARIDALSTLYKPGNTAEISDKIHSFLSEQQLTVSDIDLVINGRNGDLENDRVFDALDRSIFHETSNLAYKPYCGEYPTSTAFAVWLAAKLLKAGTVPAALLNGKPGPAALKRILVYNHYLGIHHSFVLLSAC